MESRRAFLTGLVSLCLLPGSAHANSAIFPALKGYNEKASEINLSQILTKPALLHAWDPSCAPCINDFPKLNELEKLIPVYGLYLMYNSLEKELEKLKLVKYKHSQNSENMLIKSDQISILANWYSQKKGKEFVIPTYFVINQFHECTYIDSGSLSQSRFQLLKLEIEKLH